MPDYCQCPYHNASKNENGHVKHFDMKHSISLFSKADINKPVCQRKTVSLYHLHFCFPRKQNYYLPKIRKTSHYEKLLHLVLVIG